MKRLWVFLTAILPLVACSRPVRTVSQATAQAGVSPMPTERVVETALATPLSTSTTAPTGAPAPTLAPTPTLPARASIPSLGEPVLLGRGQIVDAAFTPHAGALAIGWANGVSLVDTASAAERWWHPTVAPVIAVDVHPEGRSVAAALADGSVLIVDVETGSPSRYDGARPHAHFGDVAWSPDGRTIAVQFIGPRRGDPIYLLDVADGSLGEVPGSRVDQGTVPYLAWSPDGSSITLAALGKECPRVLDARTGETVLVLQVKDACASPWDIVWSPDGHKIAVTDALVDAHSGDVIAELEGDSVGLSPGRPGWPIRFHSGGAYVAAGGQVSGPGDLAPLVVWDAGTGQVVARFGGVDGVSEQRPLVPRVAIAFDKESLLALYEDGELVRWSFGGESQERTVLGRVPVFAAWPPLSWSADGRRFAAGSRYGGAAVWEVATGQRCAQLGDSFDAPPGAASLDAPVLSPRGDLLALTDREREELVLVGLAEGDTRLRLPGARSFPAGKAFSPDGAQIAYGAGHRLLVADVVSGEQIAVLEGHPKGQMISRVIWSPNGNALVSASGHANDDIALAPLVLWQLDDEGAWVEVFRTETMRAGYDCCVPLALFNAAGNLVAMEEFPSFQAGDFEVVVYDLEAGEVAVRLSEYQLAAWLSDEVLLASEAQRWTRLVRWNIRTGESIVSSRHARNDSVYAPGGRVYARPNDQDPYYSRGVQVQPWDAAGAMARDIYDGDVLRVLWSPDGRQVAALASSGVVVVWPVQYDEVAR